MIKVLEFFTSTSQALNLHAGGAGASMNALDHNQCLRQKNSTIPMANVPARPITNQKANG